MPRLSIVEFGDPLLRKKTQQLSAKQINSDETKALIVSMQQLLLTTKMGVGVAAPQIGHSLALAVIAIRPVAHRAKVKAFDLVMINPEITETYGYRKQLWEGCLSAGKSGLLALAPRYKKIKLRYLDEQGEEHHKIFEGLPAHVIQHEVDHLNGILFVDKVRDTASYMTMKNYKKYIVAKN